MLNNWIETRLYLCEHEACRVEQQVVFMDAFTALVNRTKHLVQ